MAKESFAWFDRIPKGAKLFATFLAALLIVALVVFAISG